MNKLLLLLLVLLNIVNVPYLGMTSTILITLYLFLTRQYNFKYITRIVPIVLLVITIHNVIEFTTILYIFVDFIYVTLSSLAIASLIQSIKKKETIRLYKITMFVLLPAALIVSLFEFNISLNINMFFMILTSITLIIVSFKKNISTTLIFMFILLVSVMINLINPIEITMQFFTIANANLILGNVLGFIYLINKKKKYKTLYINGFFLTQSITGIQRLCVEFCKEIQKRQLDYKVVILVPKSYEIELHGIELEIKRVGKLKNLKWEQISLPLFMMFKRNCELLSFDNKGPVLYPGIAMIHDVIFFEKDYSKGRWAIIMKLITQLNIYRYTKVLTVSEFTKNRIKHYFNSVNDSSVEICYTAYDHILNFNKVELINKYQDYYLSVSSIMKNKNFEYIIELAKKLPNEKFVVIGNKSKVLDHFGEIPENAIFPGYVSDEELALLYKECKGFISSSKYEGFGLTPLEALGLGCKKVYVSDMEVFNEIYGNVSIQFDNTNVEDLISKLDKSVVSEENIEEVLEKYTWSNFTTRVLNTI